MSEGKTKTQRRGRVPFARAVKPRTVGETDAFAQAVTFCLGPVMFGLIGRFLDDRLGTHPALLVIGIVLGFVGSSLTLYYRYEARIAQLEGEQSWRQASAEAEAS